METGLIIGLVLLLALSLGLIRGRNIAERKLDDLQKRINLTSLRIGSLEGVVHDSKSLGNLVYEFPGENHEEAIFNVDRRLKVLEQSTKRVEALEVQLRVLDEARRREDDALKGKIDALAKFAGVGLTKGPKYQVVRV